VAGVVSVVALTALAACAEIEEMKFPDFVEPDEVVSEPGDVGGTNWRAVDISGYGSVVVAESSISFNESDQLSGKSGCNTFLGPYALTGNRVTFGPFAMTRMMCEPEVAKQEDAFLKALATASTMEVAGDFMTLRDRDGATVMTMALIE
jgi:heat shock protein HslJ